jgi:hypothetical protein
MKTGGNDRNLMESDVNCLLRNTATCTVVGQGNLKVYELT